jgi:hypothetical protein
VHLLLGDNKETGCSQDQERFLFPKTCAHPTFCLMGTGVLFQRYGCHVMMPNTYLFLVPKLRMSGVIPLPPIRFHIVDRNSFTFVNFSYTSNVACSWGYKNWFHNTLKLYFSRKTWMLYCSELVVLMGGLYFMSSLWGFARWFPQYSPLYIRGFHLSHFLNKLYVFILCFIRSAVAYVYSYLIIFAPPRVPAMSTYITTSHCDKQYKCLSSILIYFSFIQIGATNRAFIPFPLWDTTR